MKVSKTHSTKHSYSKTQQIQILKSSIHRKWFVSSYGIQYDQPLLRIQTLLSKKGLVVDANLNDGWWSGFVIKKLEKEEEDDTFLVYFNHPPDLIQFHGSILNGSIELSKSLVSSGKMVEVFCMNDKLEAFWVPALIVKEIIVEDGDKKGYIVKRCNNNNKSVCCKADEMKPNVIVEECNVRPKPPPFFEYITLLDHVDAFGGIGWPSLTPITTRKHTKETSNSTDNTKTSFDDETNATTEEPTPPHESVNQMGDNVTNGDATMPFITPRVIPIVNSPPHEFVVIYETSAKETETETPGKTYSENNLQPMRNHNGEGCNGSEAPFTDTSDNIYDQTLSDWIRRRKPSIGSDKSKLSSNQITYVVNNSVADNETRPLINTREELRKGLAAGEMVNYSTLLERLNNVELHTPTSTIERLKECFYELEKYGFNVENPISRINMMLAPKDEQGKRAHELKDMERKMT
ncbi:unnamed protein product [Cochlearia groenlandica]